MARRPRQEQDMNMDSLLDALTNVVGILLLVLILTSLSMTEVVRKIISELPQVTQEQFDDKKVELVKTEELLQERRKLWNEMDIKEDTIEEEIAQLKLEIEELKKQNADIVDLQKQLQALLKKKQELDALNETKTERNNKAAEERDRLLAVLAETPEVEQPPAQMVRLPERSQAQLNEEPRYVLLKNNKAYYVGDVYKHLFAARDVIDQNFEKLVYTGNGMGPFTHSIKGTKLNDNGNPDDLRNRDDQPFRKFRYDGNKVASFFRENGQFGGQSLQYKATYVNGRDTISLSVIPRPEGGFSIQDLQKPNNELEKAFKTAKFQKVFLVYYVSPDSFAAYAAARTLSDNVGLKAGWHFWLDEEFPLRPAIERETTELDFDRYIPEEKLAAQANRLKAAAEKNAETAETQAATVQDAALKEYTDRWERGYKSYVADLTRAVETLEKIRGREEVLIHPEPPSIPHIYAFRPQPMPKEVPKPRPPGGNKPPEDNVIEKELNLD